MPVFSYRTIQSPSQGSFKEKGSRFLAFAFPVESDVAIRTHIDAIRRTYFDARHHCYGWMLGSEKKLFRAADDGEPNHSAGDPILGQIRSHDLTNVLIIVVRYFGGIKLGVGGLISAYREAAADALRNAIVIEQEVMIAITVFYPYERTPEVVRMVKDWALQLGEQVYGDRCIMKARISLRHYEGMMSRVNVLNATSAGIEMREGWLHPSRA